MVHNGKQLRILLAEDDVASRMMLALTLRQAGYQVRYAEDGAQALEILKQEHFDWMITDGRMAPVNGFALSKQAKILDPDLRILMVSAIYTSKDIQGYPIEAIFSKPVHAESILARLAGGH